MSDDTKRCTKCGEVKALGEFYADRRTRDGLHSYCKKCFAVVSKAWKVANPERVRACSAAWRATNAERLRAVSAAWYAANLERAGGYAAVRRARKSSSPIVERVSRAKVWERDGGWCYLCGLPADPNNWHMDHIVPLAQGGVHAYRNVAVTHPSCNLRKGTKCVPLIWDDESDWMPIS